MDISQSQKSITVTTDDCDLFLNLANRIKKSFYDTIGKRNKIIVFYNENELMQRKYLLKFLSKIYTDQIFKSAALPAPKTDDKKPKSAATKPNLPVKIDALSPEKTAQKDIKLIFQKPNSVQMILDVNVLFKGTRVVFELSRKEPVFVQYLAQNMSEGSFDYFDFKNTLIFAPRTRADIELLDSTIGFKKHLTFIVHFHYDSAKYERLKQRVIVQSSEAYASKMGILAEILTEDFELLGCSPNDDYETVRESFLALSKAYHPDLHKGESGFGEKFAKIRMAYEAIKPYYLEQKKLIGF